MPPISKIFRRLICRPKRKAIVMSKIEKEQGWTLSKSEAITTNGKSQVPPPLKFQINWAVSELFLRNSIPMKARIIIVRIIISRFIILWRYYRFDVKLQLATLASQGN